MNIIALVINLVSGAIGGHLGGSLVGSINSKYNLGHVGNSIAGVVGGGLIYAFVIFFPANLPATMGSVNPTSIAYNVLGGGMCGIVTAVVVGLIKSKMAEA
jgi:hypothetical protein